MSTTGPSSQPANTACSNSGARRRLVDQMCERYALVCARCAVFARVSAIHVQGWISLGCCEMFLDSLQCRILLRWRGGR